LKIFAYLVRDNFCQGKNCWDLEILLDKSERALQSEADYGGFGERENLAAEL
jgi:hypothetical protein